MADRVISGIDLVDAGAGGLLPHRIYVVRGAAGAGKTLLGAQYLLRGVEMYEPGVLITDQKPSSVIAQAKEIGFAIEKPLDRGQVAILNPSRHLLQLLETPADMMAIVEELLDYVKRMRATRLVIDPVVMLINTSYSAHFALTLTESLIDALANLPVTTLLITSDDRDLDPIIRRIEQSAFGVLDLTTDRMLRVSKLRYASNDSLAAPYRIESGRGIVTRERAAQPARKPAVEDIGLTLAPEVEERVQRNVESVSKLDQPYALYWIKASDGDRELHRWLERLCRREDIVCHNRGGEFVAILPATDENGVRGFETRLRDKLGARFESTQRGYALRT